VSCNSPDQTIQQAREHPQSFSYLYLENELNLAGNSPSSPVHVCGFEVINNTQNMYPTGWPQIEVQSATLPTKLIVKMDVAGAPPVYPLDLLVKTSAGVQLLRIPPPTPFSTADALLVAGAVEARMVKCPAFPSWWDSLREGFDLEWMEDPLGDPDPYRGIAELLDLRVIQPAVDATIRLSVGGGDDRVTSEIRPAGNEWFVDALVPRGSRAGLQASVDERTDTGKANLELQVTPLLLRGRNALARQPKQLKLFRSGRHEVAAVLDANGLELFDARSPALPSLGKKLELAGIRGAVDLPDGMFVWNDEKAMVLDSSLRPRLDLRLHFRTVRDAARVGPMLYLAGDKGITVVNVERWRPETFVALDGGATSILAAFGKIFVGGPSGLAVARETGRSLAFKPLEARIDVHSLRTGRFTRDTLIARDTAGVEHEFQVDGGRAELKVRSRGGDAQPLWAHKGRTVIFSLPGSTELICAAMGATRAAVPRLSRAGHGKAH